MSCTNVIPGTFIACGEGGHYCSAACRSGVPEPMTLEELRAARELADQATRAPWFARTRHISLVADNSGMGATMPTNHIANFAERDDAAFAAWCRAGVPRLLDEVARARSAEQLANVRYRAALERIAELDPGAPR